jgi:hypothetical protein
MPEGPVNSFPFPSSVVSSNSNSKLAAVVDRTIQSSAKALVFEMRPRENQRMKLRNAAALALVGWFLMVPPMPKTQEDWKAHSLTAPLRRWSILQRFESIGKCDARRIQINGQALRAGNPVLLRWLPFTMAKCLASDDPRLREQ